MLKEVYFEDWGPRGLNTLFVSADELNDGVPKYTCLMPAEVWEALGEPSYFKAMIPTNNAVVA